MKARAFGPGATGRLVPLSGITGLSHAFVPDPLPPKWNWPESLWPLLLEAHKALAALDGTGKHLRRPDLILTPLQNREAQKSSSLEGTYTDPTEQILYAFRPAMPESADDPSNALREVFNYANALKLRRQQKDELPLSLRLIRRLHQVLMNGVRGSDKNPGEFRRLQNQIGRPARFVPPPANELTALLGEFEKYLHVEDAFDPLVRAFLCHYQFEAIHPFMDGNGRVGRLLLAVTTAEGCNLSNEWLYMSDYFDRNKDEYMDRLFAVSARGDWTGWVRFCLEGVVVQANDTLRRCEQLIDLHREFHEMLSTAGGSVRLSGIIDDLFVTPVVPVTQVRERFHVTYPTAKADLIKLEQMGIIQRIENHDPITYGCSQILQITYSD